MTILDAIIQSLSRAGEYNRDDQVAPAVILWPDKERQWVPMPPVLRGRMSYLLTYTYLGDWIKKQQEAVANAESGADDRLVKAQQLKDKLKLILEGEAPYDIFVRWKPLEQQPIGGHPDLNDGVRLNIRPFMEADVLRKRPNIKWGVDRGKNPPGSPWGEERDNDQHLTLAEKGRNRSAV